MKKKIKIIDLLCLLETKNYDDLPKKINYNCDTYTLDKTRYVDSTGNCLGAMWKLDLCLSDEVEILDEEDEFEDIEEIVHEYIYGLTEREEKIDDRVSRFEEKINQLIKNQKKIIERLKDGE